MSRLSLGLNVEAREEVEAGARILVYGTRDDALLLKADEHRPMRVGFSTWWKGALRSASRVRPDKSVVVYIDDKLDPRMLERVNAYATELGFDIKVMQSQEHAVPRTFRERLERREAPPFQPMPKVPSMPPMPPIVVRRR
jgi:hypothetical protein